MHVGISTDRLSGKRHVRLRFRALNELPESHLSSSPKVIELTLGGSSYSPLSVSVATDAHCLLNALRLGFRRVRFQSANSPIFYHGSRSKFPWPPHARKPHFTTHRNYDLSLYRPNARDCIVGGSASNSLIHSDRSFFS